MDGAVPCDVHEADERVRLRAVTHPRLCRSTWTTQSSSRPMTETLRVEDVDLFVGEAAPPRVVDCHEACTPIPRHSKSASTSSCSDCPRGGARAPTGLPCGRSPRAAAPPIEAARPGGSGRPARRPRSSSRHLGRPHPRTRTDGPEPGDRCSVALAVVALAEPPVRQDRDVGRTERDRGRLHRSAQIRREDGVDAVVPPPGCRAPRPPPGRSPKGAPAANRWRCPARCPRWSHGSRRRSGSSRSQPKGPVAPWAGPSYR